jgi:hypothetical protein
MGATILALFLASRAGGASLLDPAHESARHCSTAGTSAHPQPIGWGMKIIINVGVVLYNIL